MIVIWRTDVNSEMFKKQKKNNIEYHMILYIYLETQILGFQLLIFLILYLYQAYQDFYKIKSIIFVPDSRVPLLILKIKK